MLDDDEYVEDEDDCCCCCVRFQDVSLCFSSSNEFETFSAVESLLG